MKTILPATPALPVVLTLALVVLPSLASGQQSNTRQVEFETTCGRCHGSDGRGGESGPAIIAQIAARTDTALATYIRAGRPDKGMPPFALDDNRMQPLLMHLRALLPEGATTDAEHRTVTLTDGATISGTLVNEGLQDLQLRDEHAELVLLRKTSGPGYRQVTSQADWPTYNGVPGGNRYSPLTQINKQNLASLAPAWSFPLPEARMVETTPLVVNGVMYISSANEVFALDAGNGRPLWHFQRPRTEDIAGNARLGFNRGVAIAGDRVFLQTDNVHLLALDRRDGSLLWETPMADYRDNYNGTAAPLVVGNLVIAGTAGGDEGVRGFIAAYDATTGREVWRRWTIPRPGEEGAETWAGDSMLHGAGATWMTGTYDAGLDLLYWPVGNPGPDFNGDDRAGDNLYTDSVLALKPATGELVWYFQFTPHDIHDWDAQEPPVLIDTKWHGAPRKLLIQANRNGFFYVLDRRNGELLLAKQFLKRLNWAERIGEDGRPMLRELPVTESGETYVCPGFQGGTNWYSTSYNPATGLYYFQALERCNLFSKRTMRWERGRGYMGGAARQAPGEGFVKSVRAVDIETGDVTWDLPQGPAPATASAGLLSTAAGIVFFGENSGDFAAADAASGELLWRYPTNQTWKASPMTYMFDHRQYIAIAVGSTITTFALAR
ncbi:MAG: PQQ-binding-like beta-propeller repeat protein [Gammaproteobacteria bacterium]|nr:PQQ-binding-like beta-propeller repeat protein [Gammaproteobacteria bacterium]